MFAEAFRESTLPAAVKDAASANLSTLVTQTAFRTADGEFHGFEGCGNDSGCCLGNCTHVWNYETATQHLFPGFARSLRRAAFGYSMDEDGGMHFRQMLPDGFDRFPTAAADGQMGQIMKVYLDWQLSGDRAYLEEFWPRVKRAIAFAWIEGGWDADRDGVLEGVQHNTYDIEFFGPNPLCGIYYLGALRAVEEMAGAMGDEGTRAEVRRLFESGRAWIDANLFNGEYYIQQVKGQPREQIAPALLNTMGSDRTRRTRVPDGQRVPGRSTHRPVSGRRRGPRAAGGSGTLPRHGREHLPEQLQAGTVGARQPAAHLRAQRRSRARRLRVHARRPAGRPVSVLRGGVDRAGVRDGQPDDLRWTGVPGRGVHHAASARGTTASGATRGTSPSADRITPGRCRHGAASLP